MVNMKNLIFISMVMLLLSSCVTKKKYLDVTNSKDKLQLALNQTTADLAECEKKFGFKAKDYEALQSELNNEKNKTLEYLKQIDFLKSQNSTLFDRLADLSVISKTGAETIKQSMETISDLNSKLRSSDSLKLAIEMNLKRSLENENDSDVNVEIKKGVVLISLSDNMLYKSGSAEITSKANSVLDKIANVINDYKDFDVLIEGNTDTIPIAANCFADNWDLSTKRATVIARYLQSKAGVAPGRLIAAGRSEYNPKVANDTPANRSINRRTEIIIMPRLDEFFKLMEIQPK
jgi:chemotaxis protein MotB